MPANRPARGSHAAPCRPARRRAARSPAEHPLPRHVGTAALQLRRHRPADGAGGERQPGGGGLKPCIWVSASGSSASMPKNPPASRPRAPITAGRPAAPHGAGGQQRAEPQGQCGDAGDRDGHRDVVQPLTGVLQQHDAEPRRAAPTSAGAPRRPAPPARRPAGQPTPTSSEADQDERQRGRGRPTARTVFVVNIPATTGRPARGPPRPPETRRTGAVAARLGRLAGDDVEGDAIPPPPRPWMARPATNSRHVPVEPGGEQPTAKVATPASSAGPGRGVHRRRRRPPSRRSPPRGRRGTASRTRPARPVRRPPSASPSPRPSTRRPRT